MDWAKARRGSTKALQSQMDRMGMIHTTDAQRNIHRALYNLHVADLWVLPKYRFDSTAVTKEQLAGRDLIKEWVRS